MSNPEKFPISLVTETLNQIPDETMKSLKSATAEDQMLFKITLGWISLFDPSSELSISALLQHSALEESVTFRLEKLCQNLVRSMLSQQNENVRFYTSEISKLDTSLAKFLLKFANKLVQTPQTIDLSSSRGTLILNMSRFEVIKNNKVILQSATICRALKVLHEKDSVRLEDLAFHTFFLKHYDSFLHGSKVSNLLSRVNKLLPSSVRLLQRDGVAFMKGEKENIKIQQASRASQELSTDSQWPLFIAKWKNMLNLATTDKSLNFEQTRAELRIKGQFTRNEFQLKYNVSKTQAQRIIQTWLDSKKVHKIGQGKTIQYIFNERTAV
jgi:hypothetical protein